MFDAWCKIIDESFAMNNGDSRQVFESAKTYLFDKNTSHRLYILHDDKQVPISASLLYLPDDRNSEAGHYCWGTMNDYRNKGAMSYLAEEMVVIAKNLGFKKSVAQCYDTSLRLAERIGFQIQGELDIFSNISNKTT